MRPLPLLATALLFTTAAPLGRRGPPALGAQFRVERVAPRVYAAIRTEPPGQAFESNTVFIVGTGGQIGEAAEVLGIHRDTLARKIRELGL